MDLSYKKIRLEEEQKKTDDKENGADALTAKFLKTRQILLSGEINKDLAEKIVRQLLLLEADDEEKPIYMYIDSPGGDVDAGFAIFDMIRFIKAPVVLIGMGLIASAATLVLLAVPKDRRYGLPNSRYLIHQPLGGIRGATTTEIEIQAREIEKLRVALNKLISEETGTSIEQVTEDTDRDFWMTSGEAQSYGLIGTIISKRTDLK